MDFFTWRFYRKQNMKFVLDLFWFYRVEKLVTQIERRDPNEWPQMQHCLDQQNYTGSKQLRGPNNFWSDLFG